MLQNHFKSPAHPLCQDCFFRVRACCIALLLLSCLIFIYTWTQNICYDPLAADRNWETVHALSFDQMMDEMRRNIDSHTIKCSKHGDDNNVLEKLEEVKKRTDMASVVMWITPRFYFIPISSPLSGAVPHGEIKQARQ